jgi:hypothetical protein
LPFLSIKVNTFEQIEDSKVTLVPEAVGLTPNIEWKVVFFEKECYV